MTSPRLLLLAYFIAVPAQAGAHYLRAGGTGDGSDWARAAGSLDVPYLRGDTYYVADGSYGGHEFTTPESGTAVIVVKKATAADHGTSVGWDPSYGDGVAVFGNFVFFTGYWVIDGVTGGGPGNWETGFGFKISGGGYNVKCEGDVSDLTIRHVDLENSGRDSGDNNDSFYAVGAIRNITFSYCYLHDVGVCMLVTRGSTNVTIEYSKLARNGPDNDGIHREAWSATTDSGAVIRYSVFEDISNTAYIGVVNGVGVANGWKIYGNTFVSTGRVPNVGVAGLIVVRYGAPVLVEASDWQIYNNTIIGLQGLNAGVAIDKGSNNRVYNNLWYGCTVNQIGFSGLLSTATHDYNWFYGNRRIDGCTPACDLDDDSGEPHAQVGTGNPFLNLTGGDYRLSAPTNPGLALAAPFDVDPAGTPRGTDGVWERGAWEVSRARTRLSAPTGLRIVP